jgi:hypothetical protein
MVAKLFCSIMWRRSYLYYKKLHPIPTKSSVTATAVAPCIPAVNDRALRHPW